jgi:hypothetical protein
MRMSKPVGRQVGKQVGSIGATLLLALAAAGCGGGGGGGHPVTSYVLVDGAREVVPPGVCTDVEGPFTIPTNSTMTFIIDDSPNAEYDITRIGIIDDATLLASGCNFGAAVADFSNTGSYSEQSPVGFVPAGTYDFIVGCSNAVGSCIFNLTWEATY